MNNWNWKWSVCEWMRISVVLALGVLALGAVPASADDDIGQKLSAVPAGYAQAYTSPFIYAQGPNQNSNLFTTANIPWGKLTFGIGVKAMGTQLNETDQSFRLVYEDVDLGEFYPELEGQTGDIVMEGPTIFGSTEEKGTIDVYSNGFLIESIPTITGIIDTRWVPLATPEAYVGGLFGLKGVVRWLPTMEDEDYGKIEYFGWGLQWSATGLLKDFPVDLMIGYFDQSMDIYGEQPGLEGGMLSDAKSYHLGASMGWPMITVYGGFAIESSEMEVHYTIDNDDLGELSGQEVRFTEKGLQEHRFTLGVTLDIFLELNLELAHGDLTTYSAGLMLGF